MLADMESLERRKINLEKKARGNDKEAKAMLPLVEKLLTHLESGNPARSFSYDKDEKLFFQALQLLTAKPTLYVCNVNEDEATTGNAWTEKVNTMATSEQAPMVVISAAIEAEIAALPAEEQAEFLASLGLQKTGLDRIIEEGYRLLDLLTFFTVGPKEARAWTTTQGSTAPESAGKIHSDFERGFICAETIAYNDFVTCQGEAGAKEQGKMRQEGRNYITHDGDVFHFRFNV